MISTLLLRRMVNSSRGTLLRGQQNLHFMSPCVNRSTCKLIRSSSTDASVDFEVKELQDDVPGD